MVLGQRPWSWREIQRLVEEARAGLAALEPAGGAVRAGFLAEVVERLRRRVEARVASRAGLDGGLLELAWLESPPRPSVPDNGLGGIEADLNPLAQYRDGRGYGDGVTAALEAGASFEVAPWLSLQARPRLAASSGSLAPTDASEESTAIELRQATARVLVGNLALSLGREPVFWGPGGGAGLLVSRNPGALDLLQLSSDAPFRFPGPFRGLGPARLSAFAADLGEDREFPGALLFGGKLSVLPHRNLELGVAVLNLQGGEGAPEASLGERIADLLIVPDLFVSDDYLFSEKIAGGDVRLRLPELAGLELYLEGALTDFDLRRAGQTFWMEAAYQAGLHLARLGECGASALRVEAYHTGVRFYRHHFYVSGLTLRRRVIGSALGPDGRGASLEWVHQGRGALTLAAAFEERSGDSYVILNEPFEHNIVREEDRPDERRFRLGAAWETLEPWRGLHLGLEAGLERVTAFDHVGGEARTNGLVLARLSWRR